MNIRPSKTYENRFKSVCICFVIEIVILFIYYSNVAFNFWRRTYATIEYCYRLEFAHRHVNDPLI